MITLEEARRRVLGGCSPLPPRPHPLAEARGLVTAADVRAGELIPPFANTAVDGYAVRAADTAGAGPDHPVRLRVLATLGAGSAFEGEVGPGQALRIMTGAPLPDGADAMVMVEQTRLAAGADRVEILAPTHPGDHVRAAGDDVRPGDLVVPAGTVLAAAHHGVRASLGVTEVAAFPRARVGVVSTGDELVEGPQPLGPGQIRDSNRRTLLALLAEAGCEPVDLGLIRDDEALIAEAFEKGAASCDALVSSGGVSMGEFDYVKRVLDRVGEMNWMQVAIKPAKPLAFGHVAGKPTFGLPGNPVSSMVSFELFARPALRLMMGHAALDRPRVRAIAPHGLGRRPDGRLQFFRVGLRWASTEGRSGFEVTSAGGQGSHQLTGMAAANALAVVPDGDGIPPGGEVDTIVLSLPGL
jgi:molybdenum cofactor synthesis domain-containing protein